MDGHSFSERKEQTEFGSGQQMDGHNFSRRKEQTESGSGQQTGKLLCVTNRKLCREDFSERIEMTARASRGRIGGIILREKDLTGEEYRELAGKVMEICRRYGILCILHNFVDVAAELGAQAVHLPLPVLRRLRGHDVLSCFRIIGASCHSVEDALEAQALGCTYITAGHIFATDCKKGVPPRGTAFLREVCESVSVPVYAIGGINEKNYPQVLQAGAAGACIMSGLMCCENTKEYVSRFEK